MPSLSYGIKAALFAVVEALPPLAEWANAWAINRTVKRARFRPHPLSTERDYVSWKGLTDRRWSGRPLPPRTGERRVGEEGGSRGAADH